MYDNLMELRTLRAEEAAIKARINHISAEAVKEAVAILNEQGREQGAFTTPDGCKFQLQRTEKFDFANYNRYKDKECIDWRIHAQMKEQLQNRVKATTQAMDSCIKSWRLNHDDKEPDTIELTVKVVK